MPKKYDFSGWATKFNLKCTDGRVIAKDGKASNITMAHQMLGSRSFFGIVK